MCHTVTPYAVYIDRNAHINDVIIFVQACFGSILSHHVCLIIMDRFWRGSGGGGGNEMGGGGEVSGF